MAEHGNDHLVIYGYSQRSAVPGRATRQSVSRNRLLATLTAVMMTAAPTMSACGNHEKPPEATSAVKSAEAPDPQVTKDPVVAAVKPSVVKIHAESPNCVLGGSGFVAAPDRVIATADMLAGGTTFTVEAAGQTLEAYVVSYDPDRDLSILAVPNLPMPPLPFAAERATGGSDAVLLGFPEGEGITAIPARIREVIQLEGPDVYKTSTVSREVYTIQGAVHHGMSGGPLINLRGEVLGVMFGAGIDDPDTGFALTAREVGARLSDLANTVPVATGSEKC
jgi:S1-C subfamily serine protease